MKKLAELFYPAAPPTGRQQRASQRILLAQGALASVLFALGTGNFLAGYLTTLGATPAQIAQITAIPQLGCVLQLAAPLFFERRAYRKLSIVSMCFIFRFSVGFTVFAPFLFTARNSRLRFVFALYFVSFLVAGFVTPALNQWVMQIAPQKGRGRYFALKDILSVTANALVAFLMGRQLDAQTAKGTPLTGYLVIYGFCIAAALVDLLLMSLMREPKSPAMPNIRPADLLAPVQDRRFRPLLVFDLLGYSASMFSSGFSSVYQLEVLHLSHTFITSVGMVSAVVGMASIWLWGKVADRTYWTSVILCTRGINALCFFGWWLLPVGAAPVLAPVIMALTAAGGSAAGMAGVNLQYASCPPAGKTTYLGVTAALASLVGYGAVLLGSGLQQRLAPALGGRSMALLFGVSGALSLATLLYGAARLPRAPILYEEAKEDETQH